MAYYLTTGIQCESNDNLTVETAHQSPDLFCPNGQGISNDVSTEAVQESAVKNHGTSFFT